MSPGKLYDRIIDLTDSLLLIRDSIEDINEGKNHQLLTIYNQLRSLVAEKSKGNPSLLIDVADKLKYKLKVFCSPQHKIPIHFEYLYLSPEVASKKTTTSHEVWTIQEFLEREVIIFKRRNYKVRDLIQTVANKAGGSHYPDKIPEEIADLLSISLYDNTVQSSPNSSVLKQFIIQIAKVTYEIGVIFLRSISEFALVRVLYYPKQIINEDSYLFGYFHENTNDQISFFLNREYKFGFFICDSLSNKQTIIVNKIYRSNKFYSFCLSLKLTDHLSTILSVEINGVEKISIELNYLFSIRNNFGYYTSYCNRSHIKGSRGIEQGFVFSGVSTSRFKEMSIAVKEFVEQLPSSSQPICLYQVDSFGVQLPTQDHILITGTATYHNFDTYLRTRKKMNLLLRIKFFLKELLIFLHL